MPSLAHSLAARGAAALAFRPAEPRIALDHLMRDGVPDGLLAFRCGWPAGWCSIAPRPAHRPLGGLIQDGEDEAQIWPLTCLNVLRVLRGQGLGRALIAAAVEQARDRGVTAVEASPLDPDSPSYRHMSFVPAVELGGFRRVGRTERRRHMMRRDLGAPTGPVLPR